MSDALNGMKSVGSSIVNGIGDGLSSIGDFAGNLFGGGQPASGLPAATGAMLSQGSADIPDVSGGASPGNMSALGFAPESLSRAVDMFGGGGGGNAITQMLSTMNGGGSTSGVSAPTEEGGGGFNFANFAKNAIPAGLIGLSLFRGMQTPPEIDAMNRLAADAEARSGTLSAGAIQAQQGRLPGGAQASLDQALEAVRARIRSNYASLGMTGSTPEAQDLAYAELAATAQAFQVGQGMAQTGFNAAAGADNLAASLYANILNAETARGTALGDALAEFAAGLVDPDTTLGGVG